MGVTDHVRMRHNGVDEQGHRDHTCSHDDGNGHRPHKHPSRHRLPSDRRSSQQQLTKPLGFSLGFWAEEFWGCIDALSVPTYLPTSLWCIHVACSHCWERE